MRGRLVSVALLSSASCDSCVQDVDRKADPDLGIVEGVDEAPRQLKVRMRRHGHPAGVGGIVQ